MSMSEQEFRRRIVARAAQDIGQGEEGGNNRGPFVAQQMTGTGQPLQGPGAPWCTAWLTRVTNDVAPGSTSRTAATRHLASDFRQAGALSKIAPDLSNVRPGDVIVMPRTDGSTTGAHSAIVESTNGWQIHTIQGNINPDGTNADNTGVRQGVHRRSYTADEIRQLTQGGGYGVGDSVKLARRRGIPIESEGQSRPATRGQRHSALENLDALIEGANIPALRLQVAESEAGQPHPVPRSPDARTPAPESQRG